MNVTELRIGNYVNLIAEGHENEPDTFQWSVDDYEFYIDRMNFINPITLTEEWLIKFGAKARFQQTEFIYGGFRLLWKESYKYWYVIDSDSLAYLTKIEFVHEWQNFIFILTGEELKYDN